jgi:16S rRNA (cytosine967-C5)-methyltransferase
MRAMARRPQHDTEPTGTPARRAALRLLTAVLQQGRPLESALDGALSGVDATADRALARAIAGHVLRRLPDLDALIDGATARNLPHDARARTVLRIALAQALLMGTPPHAAVATALPLVEGGPRRLVHGVLSRLLREGAALPEPPTLPPGVAKRWRGRYDLAAAARSIAQEPPTDLSLRDGAAADALAAELDAASLAPAHLRTARKGALGDWPGFADGAWWVQDLAASIPARLFGDVAGRRVIDLCAAPGGKTLQLAAAGATVTAVDISDARLERLRDNLARTGLSAEVVAADALLWQPAEAPDAVLLDAPCSATGIYRRHPDVLHLKTGRDLEPLLETQAALLDRAAGWLQPGGRLVYCVCSLEPEEGEAQLAAFLERTSGFVIDPVRGDELPPGLAPTPGGAVRTRPGDLVDQGGLDGFYIARLVRTG